MPAIVVTILVAIIAFVFKDLFKRGIGHLPSELGDLFAVVMAIIGGVIVLYIVLSPLFEISKNRKWGDGVFYMVFIAGLFSAAYYVASMFVN